MQATALILISEALLYKIRPENPSNENRVELLRPGELTVQASRDSSSLSLFTMW
jgi:hypothetical protein